MRFGPIVVIGGVVGVAALTALACGTSAGPSDFDTPLVPRTPAEDASDVSTFPDSTIRNDFEAPILDQGVPAGAAALFAGADVAPGAADAGDAGPPGGACLFEPELGSLFPRNWLRPRFRFNASAAENLFEISLTIPKQKAPLRIYTTKSGYVLDKAAWTKITQFGQGTVKLTLRSAMIDGGGKLIGGPFAGSAGELEIAPVDATGSILYWTTSGGTVLKGFKIGDESVQSVVTPAGAGAQCVACHTSTPDGLYAGLTASTSPGDGNPSAISLRSVDGKLTEPPFLSLIGKQLLGRSPQHAPSFSKSHWKAGDHLALSMMMIAGKTEIIWTDLEATDPAQNVGWGVVARGGDANMASSAAFSHDGTKIAYVSAASSAAGMISSDGKLFEVPFVNRAGGPAKALGGASDPGFIQFYPTYSADDRFVAFNRVGPTSAQTTYNNPDAEVFVVQDTGGTPTRLAANDPPACLTATKSPGITNSWPKWSPEAASSGGKDYYFLVFSSTRNPGSKGPQLYVAPIVVSGGQIKSYAALYFWNQPELENNHTPAWDHFQLPVAAPN